MIRRVFFGILLAASVISTSGCTKKSETDKAASATASGHEDPQGYFTCPMHPQVHEHKPGTCPICGMALVKVSAKNAEAKPQERASTASHGVHATEEQLKLAGIGKYTVEKKDLVFSVPVSGRLVTGREVAFQVFESDLQLVRAGLEFQGSSSSVPDEVLKGRIRQVDSLLDPSSRTVRVLGVLSKAPSKVVIDGGFHGTIQVQAKNQIAVPENAVLHAGGRDLVYLINDNELRPVAVILGKKAEGFYQILSGLNDGNVISTGPNFLIDSEAKIRGGSDQAHH